MDMVGKYWEVRDIKRKYGELRNGVGTYWKVGDGMYKYIEVKDGVSICGELRDVEVNVENPEMGW